MKTKKIRRVFIANRGENAVRICQTLREMEIETVTIFTEKERNLPHASAGDFSISLGEKNLRESYLNANLLLELAKSSQSDAIHPAYGLLSENASFAKCVEKSGIIFIGPSSKSIEQMGDKQRAKALASKLGVKIIPGMHEGDYPQDEEKKLQFLLKKAREIGFPLLIKAAAGGGGKGMRPVYKEEEFAAALSASESEAVNSFGDKKVIIEKFLAAPRHIELQVFCDKYRNFRHFYERECSIQRRHQKIIEEAPVNYLSATQHEELIESARKLCQEIAYVGAGTIEFLLDGSNIYFLEMNTRLQVEHTVTEAISGFDLVRLQLEVAEGGELPSQESIRSRGHSLEARIYAENPESGFLPTAGSIGEIVSNPLLFPRGVELDLSYQEGSEILLDYDPMIAKVSVLGTTREIARKKLISALKNLSFNPLKTNRSYLIALLESAEFKEQNTPITFVDQHHDSILNAIESTMMEASLSARDRGVASLMHLLSEEGPSFSPSSEGGAWELNKGLRNC